MSTLQVQTLQGPTSGADSNTVRVADGHNLHAKGHVVQFENAVLETMATISLNTTITLLTINFTPKFSDSLILVQAFHSQDGCNGTADNHGHAEVYVGATLVSRAWAVGNKITKVSGGSFPYSHSGTIGSWGTTPQDVELKVTARSGEWSVSVGNRPTNLYVWEIAQ